MKTKYAILNVRFPNNPQWNAHEPDMAIIMGRQGAEWPDEGMPMRLVQGVKKVDGATYPVMIPVWVLRKPLPPEGRRKSSAHRVRCMCPGCQVELSAGRLFQHVCTGEV